MEHVLYAVGGGDGRAFVFRLSVGSSGFCAQACFVLGWWAVSIGGIDVGVHLDGDEECDPAGHHPAGHQAYGCECGRGSEALCIRRVCGARLHMLCSRGFGGRCGQRLWPFAVSCCARHCPLGWWNAMFSRAPRAVRRGHGAFRGMRTGYQA
jgi:hypothetical protein